MDDIQDYLEELEVNRASLIQRSNCELNAFDGDVGRVVGLDNQAIHWLLTKVT